MNPYISSDRKHLSGRCGRRLAIAAAAFVLLMPTFGVLATPLPEENDLLGISGLTSMCDNHPSIMILQDEGPLGFVWENPLTGHLEHRPGSGVIQGSGTQEDPFIIEGWCIQPPGLFLSQTKAHVMIRNNAITGPGTPPLGAVVHIADAANITLVGNDVRKGDYGIGVWRTESLKIHDNQVTLNQKHGVWVAESHRVSITNNTAMKNDHAIGIGFVTQGDISHNTILGNQVGVLNAFSDGAVIHGNHLSRNVDGIFIREAVDVHVSNNVLEDHSGTGIALDSSPHAAVTGSQVTRTGYEGIIFWNAPHGLATNNTVTASGFADDRHAIRMANSPTSTAANNTATHSANGIVFDASPQAIIYGNQITDNDETGLTLWENPDTEAYHNTLTRNGIGAQVIQGSQGVTLHSNNLWDNQYGKALEAQEANGTVLAAGNWWGCSEGPEHMDCDHVAGDATVPDWLTSPHPGAP